jgi:HD-like signal output (HDOD) protein
MLLSTNDVAPLIRQDGALSGAVFRVVGSPVFGLHAKVDTVE